MANQNSRQLEPVSTCFWWQGALHREKDYCKRDRLNRNYPFPAVILFFWLAGVLVFWQILSTSSWNRFRFPCAMPRVNLQVNCFWDFNSKHQRPAFEEINLGILRWHFRDEKWREGTGSKALKPSPGGTEHHGTQLSSNSGSCSHGFRTDPQAREGFTFCSRDIGTRADMRHAKPLRTETNVDGGGRTAVFWKGMQLYFHIFA